MAGWREQCGWEEKWKDHGGGGEREKGRMNHGREKRREQVQKGKRVRTRIKRMSRKYEQKRRRDLRESTESGLSRSEPEARRSEGRRVTVKREEIVEDSR